MRDLHSIIFQSKKSGRRVWQYNFTDAEGNNQHSKYYRTRYQAMKALFDHQYHGVKRFINTFFPLYNHSELDRQEIQKSLVRLIRNHCKQ